MHMRLGMGALGWTPDAFWKATPHELVAACEGARGEWGQTESKNKEFQKLFKDVKEAQKNGNNN